MLPVADAACRFLDGHVEIGMNLSFFMCESIRTPEGVLGFQAQREQEFAADRSRTRTACVSIGFRVL